MPPIVDRKIAEHTQLPGAITGAPGGNAFRAAATGLIVVLTLAAYLPVAWHPFVDLDDFNYVVNNRAVHDGLTLDALRWALTATHEANWHPLTWLSHLIDVQLFGLEPAGHHLHNLLLHLANTLLLLAVLRKMTGQFWPSASVAAAFALHPLHVESVAWVAERKDLLSTFFWLATLWAYVHFVQHGQRRWYVATCLLLALGLMAKPMLVTLPFVLLLLDLWPLQRVAGRWTKQPAAPAAISPWRLILEKTPMFSLVLASCAITYQVQKTTGAVLGEDVVSLGARVENALVSYVVYLGKMFVPINLAVYYPHPSLSGEGRGWPAWQVAAAAGLLLLISVAAVRLARPVQRRYFLVGWLWFLGTLVPVIGFVQVGRQALADRYTYVPLIGLFIIIAWGLADLVTRRHALRSVVSVMAVAALLACVPLTGRQLSYWQDTYALFNRALAVTRNNRTIRFYLAESLRREGRFAEAIPHYRLALEMKPTHALTHRLLAECCLATGQTQEARSHLIQAVRLNPTDINAHFHLAGLLADNDPVQALGHLQVVLQGNPDHAPSHYLRGSCLAVLGQLPQAEAAYRQALKFNPDLFAAHNNLGVILVRQARYEDALPHYQRAVELIPTDPLVRNNLGVALARLKRFTEARRQFAEAVRLKPDFADAQRNLVNAEAELTNP